MNYTNLLPVPHLVREDHAVFTESGGRISPADVYARRIAREADRWRRFAARRTRMRPDTLARKALDATAFTVGKRASSFAVPSKLTGTAHHQRTLWSMVSDRSLVWAPLDLVDTGDGLAVHHDGEPIGEVQPKHLGWLRPLVPFGAKAYLTRITGHEYEGYTLGVNCTYGHVGAALDRLLVALGDDSPSGDGALRLVVRPELGALRRDPISAADPTARAARQDA